MTLPAAYVLAQSRFRARRVVMPLFVITMYFGGGIDVYKRQEGTQAYLMKAKRTIDKTIADAEINDKPNKSS